MSENMAGPKKKKRKEKKDGRFFKELNKIVLVLSN